jgi:hypothetical protein
MKKTPIYFLMMLFVVTAVMSSCGKDDNDDNNNNNNNTTSTPSNPLPTFTDSDAVLAAIRVNSTQTVPVVGTINVVIDAASGGFLNGSNYFDAGAIKVNNFALTKFQNNAYAVTGTSEGALDFSTGDAVNWNVAGAGSIAGFTHTTSNAMVDAKAFAANTPSTIDIDGNVTLSLEGYPLYATDILWLVIDKNGNSVKKTNNASSVTFTAAELSTLTKGANALIEVAAYNYSSETFGGKKVYFVNETATTKSVTLE